MTITQGTNKLVPDPRALPEAVERTERPAKVLSEGWTATAGYRAIDAIVAFRR